MSDEELIARLREGATWDDDTAAADRIEALTEQLAAAQHDAKEAEAYAEEVERELRDTQDRANAFATKEYYTEMRAERAEAKLAKVVEALEALIQLAHDCEKELTEDLHHMDFCGESEPLTKARATLAEIKGT